MLHFQVSGHLVIVPNYPLACKLTRIPLISRTLLVGPKVSLIHRFFCNAIIYCMCNKEMEQARSKCALSTNVVLYLPLQEVVLSVCVYTCKL